MWNIGKKGLYNKIASQETLIRHILDHQFDSVQNEVKTSAFQIDQLKKGLSLSVKSKLNPTLRTKVIQDLEKNLFKFQCDYETLASNIVNIIDDNGKNIYQLYPNTINHHPAHAEVKLANHVISCSDSLLRKYRKLLMDEFFQKP